VRDRHFLIARKCPFDRFESSRGRCWMCFHGCLNMLVTSYI
jgi:hypothetical protein